jgi:hypothetical protein
MLLRCDYLYILVLMKFVIPLFILSGSTFLLVLLLHCKIRRWGLFFACEQNKLIIAGIHPYVGEMKMKTHCYMEWRLSLGGRMESLAKYLREEDMSVEKRSMCTTISFLCTMEKADRDM